MAQRVHVVVVCDMHGDDTPSTETIRFTVDSAGYEIDLCADHDKKLRDAFAPYVGAARRRGSAGPGRRGRAQRSSAGGAHGRNQQIREWARKQGHQVSQRGRVARSLVVAYDAAH